MNQAILSTKLSNVIKAVATRPTLPVLSHVLLKVKNGQATLAGCNLEMFVIERFDIDSDDFECCLPAKLFTDLVNAFDGDIVLTFNNNNLSLNGEDTNIKTVPSSEFPILPELPETEPAEFESSQLAYLIAKTVYAAGGEKETREILKGVHFEFGDKVVASAADGFRSAFCQHKYSVELPSVTIPATFLVTLASALADKKTTVNVWTTDTQAIFSFGNTIMVSQLIIGNFVDVPRLLPKEHKVKATVNKKELEKARKTLAILATGDLIRVDFNTDNITLLAESPESGDCKRVIECKIEGEQYSTAFNQLYMKETLLACGSQVTIEQNGPATPFVLYTPDKHNDEMHMVMPLFLRDKPDEN